MKKNRGIVILLTVFLGIGLLNATGKYSELKSPVYKKKDMAELKIVHKGLTANLSEFKSLLLKVRPIKKAAFHSKWKTKSMDLKLKRIRKNAVSIKVLAQKGSYKDKANAMKKLIFEIDKALRLVKFATKNKGLVSRNVQTKMNSIISKVNKIDDAAALMEPTISR